MGELLSQVLPSQPVSRETLTRVAAASPYPSLALAAPAAVVLQRLADDSADDSERAGWLVDLSNRLGDLGRREEALAAIEEAVTIYRQLAQARPDAFLPDLAAALNNQSAAWLTWGGGRRPWPRSRKPSPSTASSPRPAPTRSCPTSPWR